MKDVRSDALHGIVCRAWNAWGARNAYKRWRFVI